MTDTDARTVTKRELVNRIADRLGLTKVTVRDVTQQFLGEIIHELSEGNRLEFRDFGVFEVRERAARIAQNPRTLEKVEVPAKRVVKFKVGRVMRERVCDEIEDDESEESVAAAESPKRGGAVEGATNGSGSGRSGSGHGASGQGASGHGGSSEGAGSRGSAAGNEADEGGEANEEGGRGTKPQPPAPPPTRPGSPF